MNRTVRLPAQYWRIIDREAKRCKRSGERQLEALLSRLFGLGDVNIEISETGVLTTQARRTTGPASAADRVKKAAPNRSKGRQKARANGG